MRNFLFYNWHLFVVVLIKVIGQGAISAPMFAMKGPSMVEGQYPTAFPLKHQQKVHLYEIFVAHQNSSSRMWHQCFPTRHLTLLQSFSGEVREKLIKVVNKLTAVCKSDIGDYASLCNILLFVVDAWGILSCGILGVVLQKNASSGFAAGSTACSGVGEQGWPTFSYCCCCQRFVQTCRNKWAGRRRFLCDYWSFEGESKIVDHSCGFETSCNIRLVHPGLQYSKFCQSACLKVPVLSYRWLWVELSCVRCNYM